MTVQLFYFDHCQSYRHALDNLREALRQESPAAEVEMVPVTSDADAKVKRFIGSPTIRVDGVDLDGPEAESLGYGFGCRVYREDGQTAGWPSVARIIRALSRARGSTAASG